MSDLIYLASPYSRYPFGREAAYIKACQKAADLMEEGKKVFCPIAHSHAIETLGMNDVKEGDWWLAQDFAVLKQCRVLIVYKMEGWEESYGVAREIEFAREHNIPVEYVDN